MGGRLGKRLRLALALCAVIGLVTAWWRYPVENRFSIMSCTISFLGSPDAGRNPHGWRFYQAGMTALVVLLFSLTAERHKKLRPQIGTAALFSTAALSVSLALVFVVTWIPDSRERLIFGLPAGDIHTRLAILALPIMGCGILLDGVALWWRGVRFHKLWPFHLYAAIVFTGTVKLMTWERMCRQDPSLAHWPGEGLYSTPLWEWIVFWYFVGFMIWMARGTVASAASGLAPAEVAKKARPAAPDPP